MTAAQPALVQLFQNGSCSTSSGTAAPEWQLLHQQWDRCSRMAAAPPAVGQLFKNGSGFQLGSCSISRLAAVSDRQLHHQKGDS